jgi:hypothetical protein
MIAVISGVIGVYGDVAVTRTESPVVIDEQVFVVMVEPE